MFNPYLFFPIFSRSSPSRVLRNEFRAIKNLPVDERWQLQPGDDFGMPRIGKGGAQGYGEKLLNGTIGENMA